MPTLRTADGARVVYTRLGPPTPDPVIVLPGGPGRGVEYLEDLAGAFDSRGAVILHPRGTPTSGGRSRGWWHDADDVIELLDALRLERGDIVAHSAGTRLALATAVRHRHRVHSLVLVTPPATWLSGVEHDGEEIGRARHEPLIDAALVSLRSAPAGSQPAFDRRRSIEGPAGYAAWTQRERLHDRRGEWSVAAPPAWFENIPADAVERILAAPRPPISVVSGRDDILVGRRPVHSYASALNARLIELAACGHYPWVEQPAAFRAAIAEIFT